MHLAIEHHVDTLINWSEVKTTVMRPLPFA